LNQSDNFRIEEPEIYHNTKGDSDIDLITEVDSSAISISEYYGLY